VDEEVTPSRDQPIRPYWCVYQPAITQQQQQQQQQPYTVTDRLHSVRRTSDDSLLQSSLPHLLLLLLLKGWLTPRFVRCFTHLSQRS